MDRVAPRLISDLFQYSPNSQTPSCFVASVHDACGEEIGGATGARGLAGGGVDDGDEEEGCCKDRRQQGRCWGMERRGEGRREGEEVKFLRL
jgi:hypothetical protein